MYSILMYRNNTCRVVASASIKRAIHNAKESQTSVHSPILVITSFSLIVIWLISYFTTVRTILRICKLNFCLQISLPSLGPTTWFEFVSVLGGWTEPTNHGLTDCWRTAAVILRLGYNLWHWLKSLFSSPIWDEIVLEHEPLGSTPL